MTYRVIALAICCAAAPAGAQNVTPSDPTPTASLDAFSGTPAVADGALAQVAGREDSGTQIAIATQRNTVSGNSVVGRSVTGNVAIDGNAFQNLQGLAVISANSGNNVAINSAMNVTINLAPRP
ncbi:hypothetical protein [Sphingomonas jeddahensis]|uniref:Uncharacterized protein n=1 Tax=Sphingomonas jeddahensis TaxID=1915074 RepID=A0A1V2ESR5_9SPHN|nr:hypothetical protein [Sphingomonas jeddahensis]ONF95209.1 hypothetical protein SPHI_26300 [Sphingomonas jeddahensis]